MFANPSHCLYRSPAAAAQAQQPIANVEPAGCNDRRRPQVSGGRAMLVGSSTVTAKDHTAELTLTRGGTVRVCATSGLHIAASQSSAAAPPLMLALDRGAVEVKMEATTSDAVITPDLRFSLRTTRPARPPPARHPQRRHLRRESRRKGPHPERSRPVRRSDLSAPARPARALRTRQPQRGRRQRKLPLRLSHPSRLSLSPTQRSARSNPNAILNPADPHPFPQPSARASRQHLPRRRHPPAKSILRSPPLSATPRSDSAKAPAHPAPPAQAAAAHPRNTTFESAVFHKVSDHFFKPRIFGRSRPSHRPLLQTPVRQVRISPHCCDTII